MMRPTQHHGDGDTRAARRGLARRGTVMVALLLVLMGLQMAMALSVMGGARDQDLSAQRLASVRAQYAAEAGMNMAMRELFTSVDEDGDGTVGSVSSEGNSANDPLLSGNARVVVVKAMNSGNSVLTATGRSVESRRTLRAMLAPGTGGAGLNWLCWNVGASIANCATFDYTQPPTRIATTTHVNFPNNTGVMWPAGPLTYGAMQFKGNLTIPSTGSWTFTLGSDDGTLLYINGALVVNNDGAHSFQNRTGTVTLSAGVHTIDVRFFQNAGGWGCVLSWLGPGVPSTTVIPASAFTR